MGMGGAEFWVDFTVAIIAPVLIACLVFIILADDGDLWPWSQDEYKSADRFQSDKKQS